MKTNRLLTLAACLALSGAAAHAQSAITTWNFDNLSAGLNASPAPSTCVGAATALGMANTYNQTNSVSNPDILSLSGSSGGGANAWQIIGGSTIAGDHGNGWSSSAPLGTQGAQFTASTLGYYQIKVSFDVYATADAEADLQVQYTTDGKDYVNVPIVSAGSDTILVNNNPATTNLVQGSYLVLQAGWNNAVTVNLTGVSGADNAPKFGLRLVNAATGAACTNTAGNPYNNTSGSWSFDNVAVQGTSIDTVAEWTFESEPNDGTVITNPAPEIGGVSVGQAYSIGFNNGYVYNGGEVGSVDQSDVTSTGGTSSGTAGPNAWRLRGGAPGNAGWGWNTAAPIGTQGSEYDASTAGYSNVVINFDLYSTSQGEAKMCVLYTTDGWVTTNVAQNLGYGFKPAAMLTNTTSQNTVLGTYFYNTNGQGNFNNFVVDFTGNHAADNNPLFGFRVVNAATSFDCVNYTGGSYNNQSGNWRMDNVTVGGTAGNLPPALTVAPAASVDAPFTNLFTDDAHWRTNITAVYVNGLPLTNAAYAATAGELVFTPAKSVLLQSAGLKNVIILAKGYGTARVAQPLAAGVAVNLAIVNQPAGPTASGGTLVANPFLLLADQYGNGTTNPYTSLSVTASAGGPGGWTLNGDTQQASVNGLVSFTNLTASLTGSTVVSNAMITFTVSGYPPVTTLNSLPFNIGAAPVPFTPGNLAVLQVDSTGSVPAIGVADNTTFSIIELNPSLTSQASPLNLVPISATGTNGLRFSTSGSTGRLALSDDGTLICFAAFQDNSAATPDETLNLTRLAVGMNATNGLTNGLLYTSISLGGSEARGACILGDGSGNWIADDKGGLYEGSPASGNVSQPNLNAYNNVVVKSFGGNPYIETQKAVSGQHIPVVYKLGLDVDTGLYDVTFGNNLATDGNASDFYLLSTNNGLTYDILYVCDQVSGSQGILNKYSLVNGFWTSNGTYTNSTGFDGLFAATNGINGAYLFYTTGSGGTPGNSVVRLTDAGGWNQPLTVTSSNLIYQAPGGVSLKGLTFVPLATANATEPTPAPVLTAAAGASVTASFTVTDFPEVPAWRSAITGITVNGSTLPPAAYSTATPGGIVFNPAQSALLQTAGVKSIVVSATGFGQAEVWQSLAGVPAPVLGGATLQAGNLTFTFTNATGFSYSVHATNVLGAPVSTWPVIGTATENPAGSGHFQFTDPQPASGNRFYSISQP